MFVGIIVAAGSGNRMSSKQKKQYIDVQGKPLLYYSLRAFQDSSVDEIILVTSADEIEYCQKEIIEKYKMTKVTKVVAGGEERYESVYEGLKVTNPDNYVLIHDGARPMVSVELIERIMKAVVKYKACIAAVPVKDTIKRISMDGRVVETLARSALQAIQTPQAFPAKHLQEAYGYMFSTLLVLNNRSELSITDDSMIMETYGKQTVHTVMGDYTNIKVTTPEDLILANAFLSNAKK